MEISIENRDNYSIIKINNEKLDNTVSPDFKAEFVKLNKQGVKNFVVDLSDVKYCDSSGLSAFLIGNRLCNELSGKFVINSLQEMVKKLIEILQLDKVLNITNELSESQTIMA